MLGLHRNL